MLNKKTKSPVYIFVPSIFLAILFLLISQHANAQYRLYLDSLKHDLANAKDDTSRVSKLNLLSYAVLDETEQLDYAQQALSISERINYEKGKGDALVNIGYFYNRQGDIVKGMKYFQQAYEICKSIKYQFGIASSLNNMGEIYYNIGDISKALENFQKGLLILETFEDVESRLGVGALLNNIGFIYQKQNDYSKALDYYQKSKTVREEINDSIGISASLANMAEVYKEQGDYLKGMEFALKSLTIVKSIGDKDGIASSLNSIGRMYEAQDSLVLANDYFKKALSINEEIGNKSQETAILGNIGKNLFKQKRFIEAEEYCSRSLQLSKELGYPEYISKTSYWLSQVYEAKGDYQKAYEMHLLFKKYSDSTVNTANTKKLTQLQMQFDFDKKEDSLNLQQQITDGKLKQKTLLAQQQQQQLELNKNEFALSNKEKDLQKLAYLKTQGDLQNEQLQKNEKEKLLTISEKEKQLQQAQLKTFSQEKVLDKFKLQRLWIYSIVILVLLALFSLYFINRNRLKQRRLKIELAQEKIEQEKKEAQFQRSLADVSLTALRSQMNPHFIFNCLNSIKLYTTQNNTEAATEYLSKFSKLIRLVMENSRNDRITLKSELEALRLYIEMEVMRFKEKLAYSINVNNDVETDYIEIPPLLLQPYVENAIWHGLMHKEDGGRIDINVSMQKDESLLEINIIDNGIGRARSAELRSKTATKHKSYGMKVTSERIALINQIYKTGADVCVHDLVDTNGKALGTEVTIKIPV